MVNANKKEGNDGGTCGDYGGENLLDPEDKRVLRPVGTDEDEVEGEVWCIAGEEIDVLIGFQGVRNNV